MKAAIAVSIFIAAFTLPGSSPAFSETGRSVAAVLYGVEVHQADLEATAGPESQSEALAAVVANRRTDYLLRHFDIDTDSATVASYMSKRYPGFFSEASMQQESDTYRAIRDALQAVLDSDGSVDEMYPRVQHVVPSLQAWRELAADSNDELVASFDSLIARTRAQRQAERLELLKPLYASERIREAICALDDVRAELDASMQSLERASSAEAEKRLKDLKTARCWIAAATWLRAHTRRNLTIVDLSLVSAEQLLYAQDPVEKHYRKMLRQAAR